MPVDDKWDRAELFGHCWVYLSPGMATSMATMTTPEVLDLAGVSSDSDADVFHEIVNAEPGDWIGVKEGILIRLHNRIDL